MVGDKKAIVTLQSDQKSKAIGKNGVNIRLASMLCGVDIELNEIGASTSSNGDKNGEKEEIKDLRALFGEA
jgi:N utilization substance protein A